MGLCLIGLVLCASCTLHKDEKSKLLYAKIDSLYQHKCYKEALDSISLLRKKYPNAIEERKKALAIWQQSSLKMAQLELMQTDSALQTMPYMQAQATSLLQKNKLKVKEDSLKARFDAMCAVVRMIRKRMKN